MGFDTTPSSDKRIFVLGIVTIVSLVAVMPALRSYFFSVLDPLEARLVRETGHRQLDTYRQEQQRSMGDVGASIQQLGDRGRVANAGIAPRQGDRASISAVGGWTLLPNAAAQADAEHAYDVAAARRAALEAAVDGGVPLEAPAPATPPAPVPVPTPGTP